MFSPLCKAVSFVTYKSRLVPEKSAPTHVAHPLPLHKEKMNIKKKEGKKGEERIEHNGEEKKILCVFLQVFFLTFCYRSLREGGNEHRLESLLI